MSATDHIHDARRLRALHATGLLEADEVPVLDRVTRLAVRCLRVPAAMVSLIDADRQVVISAAGPDEPGRHEQAPLSQSLCRHVVATGAPLTVPDARADARWRGIESPGDGRLTSYAGMPLRAGPGQVLGALCVIDAEPRQWSSEQLATLEDLAALAEAEIAVRLARAEPSEQQESVQAVLDRVPEPIARLDTAGAVTAWNSAAVHLFGRSAAEAVGRPLSELISPERLRDDYERLLHRVLGEDARAQQAHRVKLTAVDRSGREFPAEIVTQARTGRDGTQCHVVLHAIGDHHEDRRDLEDEPVFWRALVDSLDVRVGACDSDGRMIVVNQPLRQTREQRPGLHVLELGEAFGLLDADGRTPLRGAHVPLARALAGEHVDGQQIVMRPPGAAARRFSVNGRPIDAPDGRRLGAVVTLDDITAAHRAEVLRAAQHAAAEMLADAASAQEAADGVVAAVTDALDWTCGEYWQVEEDQVSIVRVGSWSRPGRDLSAFTGDQMVVFPRGKALPGLAWERGEPVWIADLASDPYEFSRKPGALEAGLRCTLALPVRSGGHVLGVLIFATD
ncbi:GAF domain-containing protein, partial [Planomonospora parontospora]